MLLLSLLDMLLYQMFSALASRESISSYASSSCSCFIEVQAVHKQGELRSSKLMTLLGQQHSSCPTLEPVLELEPAGIDAGL
jgi:hypothetical protein